MAASLIKEGVTIEHDGRPVAGGPQIGINVRGDTLRVYDRGTLLVEEAGVLGWVRNDRRRFTVNMVNGGTYTATLIKNCGCGGGR